MFSHAILFELISAIFSSPSEGKAIFGIFGPNYSSNNFMFSIAAVVILQLVVSILYSKA